MTQLTFAFLETAHVCKWRAIIMRDVRWWQCFECSASRDTAPGRQR